MTEELRDHFVYRTYDADGQLLYIGCTKNLPRRWKEHKSERPAMVEATARCHASGPYPRSTARAMESASIEAENPLHNFTLARRRERREQANAFEATFNALLNVAGLTLNEAAEVMLRLGYIA